MPARYVVRACEPIGNRSVIAVRACKRIGDRSVIAATR